MQKYWPFDPNPRRPAVTLPPNSCDSQFHVLGSPEKYPVRSGAAYEMPTANWRAAKRMHDTLGIERGIIVQTTTYGADHQAVIDALAQAGPGYRGCANAIVFVERDDAYIEKLHQAGIRGARFSFRKELGVVLDPAEFDRALARIRELGWYVKIQPEKDGIVSSAEFYENLDLPVLVDHMARPDPEAGTDDPNLAKMLELLSKGNFWMMLSLIEKTSKGGFPWNDVIPVIRTFIEAAPDRLVWASDWPHPVSLQPPPNEADLIEFLFRAATDESERQRILVDNPAALFGFEQ